MMLVVPGSLRGWVAGDRHRTHVLDFHSGAICGFEHVGERAGLIEVEAGAVLGHKDRSDETHGHPLSGQFLAGLPGLCAELGQPALILRRAAQLHCVVRERFDGVRR